jgi:hypothetical protein
MLVYYSIGIVTKLKLIASHGKYVTFAAVHRKGRLIDGIRNGLQRYPQKPANKDAETRKEGRKKPHSRCDMEQV